MMQREDELEISNPIQVPQTGNDMQEANVDTLVLSRRDQSYDNFVLVHNNLPAQNKDDEQNETFTFYSLILSVPRRIYFYFNQGKEVVVVNASLGALQIGKFAGVKAANYGVSYVREFISKTDFGDLEAKQSMLTIFDETIAAANGRKDLELSIFANLPYAVPSSVYNKMAKAFYANIPIVIIKFGMKLTSSTTLLVASYNLVARQSNDYNSAYITSILVAAMLKYAEYFPPVVFSMQRDFAFNRVKELWQNTAACNKLVNLSGKENLAPRLKGLMENVLSMYSEEIIEPKACVLNNSQSFIDKHHLSLEDIDVNSAMDIRSKEEFKQKLALELRAAYVKSLALTIFAQQESKRIHALVKSLGAKLSVGSPGSQESMALDVMLVSLANMLAVGVEEYILTEGYTAVNAHDKIKNAHEISKAFDFELKYPSYVELTYSSLWLKRPEISLALDHLFNSLTFSGQMANLASKVRNEINSARSSSCQKLTWGFQRFSELARSKRYLLIAAAATAVPIAYATVNKYYNETCDKQIGGCKPMI